MFDSLPNSVWERAESGNSVSCTPSSPDATDTKPPALLISLTQNPNFRHPFASKQSLERVKKMPNMKTVAIFLMLLLSAHFCRALDITTRKGTTYTHCEITRVEKNGVTVEHRDGIAYIAFEDLPAPLRRNITTTR